MSGLKSGTARDSAVEDLSVDDDSVSLSLEIKDV